MDRTSFALRRLPQLLLIALGVLTATFFLIRLVPGDPAAVMLGVRATPESLAELRKILGTDQPIVVQFAIFLGNVLRGDLGTSITLREPVTAVMIEPLQTSLLLIAYSLILSTLISVPLAIASALRPGGVIDQTVRAVFTVTLAMPSFWIGIILILTFSVNLGLFPVTGYGRTFPEHLHHLFLPALTIALYLGSLQIRTLRNSILDVVNGDHVAFARSQGLSSGVVFRRHILRNSLVSTVTVLGVLTGWLIGATVVIETVFSVPGAGRLLVDSVFRRDFPVLQGLTLVFGVLVLAINFLMEVAYSLLDPRVRL